MNVRPPKTGRDGSARRAEPARCPDRTAGRPPRGGAARLGLAPTQGGRAAHVPRRSSTRARRRRSCGLFPFVAGSGAPHDRCADRPAHPLGRGRQPRPVRMAPRRPGHQPRACSSSANPALEKSRGQAADDRVAASVSATLVLGDTKPDYAAWSTGSVDRSSGSGGAWTASTRSTPARSAPPSRGSRRRPRRTGRPAPRRTPRPAHRAPRRAVCLGPGPPASQPRRRSRPGRRHRPPLRHPPGRGGADHPRGPRRHPQRPGPARRPRRGRQPRRIPPGQQVPAPDAAPPVRRITAGHVRRNDQRAARPGRAGHRRRHLRRRQRRRRHRRRRRHAVLMGLRVRRRRRRPRPGRRRPRPEAQLRRRPRRTVAGHAGRPRPRRPGRRPHPRSTARKAWARSC